QRPEMLKLYNTKINKGESIRVFPISNWTEKDIWQYIQREKIDIVPLYFAAERPVVYRDGNIIMVDDDRLRLNPGETPEYKSVRFRPLGCYPLTGGIESTATTLDEIIDDEGNLTSKKINMVFTIKKMEGHLIRKANLKIHYLKDEEEEEKQKNEA
ncbi:MAG: phosphoadenosine phosphosulfate reductase family protein, partial [Clostridia bacterium]|nr:phosphoadenosine phosphosulfate reductase family protein [Clostridia bacterium]